VNENETKRGWWWRSWYHEVGVGIPGTVAWDDARSNVFEEDGDIWVGHDPPTNGLADAYNVRPYPPQFSPGDSYRCWVQRYNWRASWRWSDGRVVPRRVQNEMAGYRDPAVVEVA